MSILIKGRNKPKNCLMCQFHGFGGYKNELIVCSLTGRSEGRLSNVPDCPLVEVPTPHGRLGDLDKLEQMFADIDDAPYSGFDGSEPFYSAEDAAQIIRLSPTIIEAEE